MYNFTRKYIFVQIHPMRLPEYNIKSVLSLQKDLKYVHRKYVYSCSFRSHHLASKAEQCMGFSSVNCNNIFDASVASL